MLASGALLLDKPAGITSFRALNPIKRLLKGTKVGHAGTLDRFAEGLLLVLFGSMTKLAGLLTDMDKRYRAYIRFGVETETDDPEGAISATAALPHRDRIPAAIEHFSGTILQKPPRYSALHIDGERAYRRTRRGEQIEMPVREITIYDLQLIEMSLPSLILDVHCSKGTYIRALARDMGRYCDSAATLERLERVAIGPFRRADAVGLDDIERGGLEHDGLERAVLSPYRLIQSLPAIQCVHLQDSAVRVVANGGHIDDSMLIEPPVHDGPCALFSADRQFVALCLRTAGSYGYRLGGFAQAGRLAYSGVEEQFEE